MNDKKAAAYRLGFITLAILTVLTIGEFLVAVYMETLVLLFIIALLKAAVIVQNFMQIAAYAAPPESDRLSASVATTT